MWVWHPETKVCWLKKTPDGSNPTIATLGDRVPWTSGSFFDLGAKWTAPGACVHTVLTSNGNSYMNWQSRVMYATYLAAAAKDTAGVMKAFTRVLHRHTDDELMMEARATSFQPPPSLHPPNTRAPPQIPTFRTDPVHINCDEYCSFPVADRAPALVEWMKTNESRQCSHILLVGAAADPPPRPAPSRGGAFALLTRGAARGAQRRTTCS